MHDNEDFQVFLNSKLIETTDLKTRKPASDRNVSNRVDRPARLARILRQHQAANGFSVLLPCCSSR